MDKAVRDVLVGKLFELSVSKHRAEIQYVFREEFGLEVLSPEEVAHCERDLRRDLVECLVDELVDQEFAARGLDRELHGLILEKDFREVRDLAYDPPRLWAALKEQFHRSREGHSDRELRQEYIRMRMQG